MSEAAASTVPTARSGLKVWVIVLAVMLAASLAGGGVYFMTARDHARADEEKSGTDGKTGEGPKLPALYVKLDPPFVANFEAKGAMRFLQVSVEVMTRDPAVAEVVKTHDPMIRNDLLMLFGSQTYDTISTHEGKEQLRAQALEVVRKVVVAEGSKGENLDQLYFTSFVMQ
jgi:flagellar protein FliL